MLQATVKFADAARAGGAVRRVWEAAEQPALLMLELREVSFWIAPGIDGAIFLEDGALVEESARFMMPVNAPGRVRGRAVRRPREAEILGEYDEVLLQVDPGWMNYFHWLLIHAPALRAAGAWLDAAIPAALPRHADHLQVPRPIAYAPEVVGEALSGLARPLHFLAPGAYRARRLYRLVAEAPRQILGIACTPWWEALLALDAELAARTAGAAPGAGTLYVSRRGAQRRPFAAEADPRFTAVLSEHRVAIPQLAGLGLAAQARIFRDARRVIGPHGSGLANLLFCAPGAEVLEFNAAVAGETEPRSHFRRLAERRGLAYREVRVDAAGAEAPAAALARWLEERR